MISINSLVRDMISVSHGTTYCPVWEINDDKSNKCISGLFIKTVYFHSWLIN